MRKKWFVRTCLTAVLAGAIAAPGYGDGKSESCRKFVQQFYTWYVGKCEKGFSVEDAVKTRPRSFSPAIFAALRDNDREEKKHPEEIVGLDFDPVVNAQDFAQKYVAGVASRRGARYLVPVYGLWDGKRSNTPDVTAELQWVSGHWRFEDFRYRRDPRKTEERFLKIMDDYRREWRKDAKHSGRG